MQVELAGDQAVAGDTLCRGICRGSSFGPNASCLLRRRMRQRPLVGVELDQLSAQRDAGELFEQQTALASATQAEFADELFVAGAVRRAALDQANLLAVGLRIGAVRLRHRYADCRLTGFAAVSSMQPRWTRSRLWFRRQHPARTAPRGSLGRAGLGRAAAGSAAPKRSEPRASPRRQSQVGLLRTRS